MGVCCPDVPSAIILSFGSSANYLRGNVDANRLRRAALLEQQRIEVEAIGQIQHAFPIEPPYHPEECVRSARFSVAVQAYSLYLLQLWSYGDAGPVMQVSCACLYGRRPFIDRGIISP